MLKTILIISSFSFLLSVEYILNIEQGDTTVSKYTAAINPYIWDKSSGSSRSIFTQTVDANKIIKPLLFKQFTDQIETDVIPKINIYNTNGKKTTIFLRFK
jgi:hypothetical protein